MSLINKMLQELDRRNAMTGAEPLSALQQVKAVSPAMRRSDEWFWRTIAVLVLAALAWVGWVAHQIQPRAPLVTEQTLNAQAQSRKGSIAASASKPAAAPAPPPVAPAASNTASPAPASAPAVPAPAAEAKSAQTSETFKLARTLETPIVERAPSPPRPQAPKPAAKKANAEALVAAPVILDKRDRGKTNDAAESRFRRAAALLGQGRVSEAEEQLLGALQSDPAHQPARQTYVALLLEQQRVPAAQQVLREALDANPAQAAFALALARIHAEQRDYLAALDVIDRAGSAAQNADFQVLRGAVLQRLGRHAEAVEAYRRAVQNAPQPGGTWAGLGISLEALGRKAEAAEAFQRALGAGPLNKEVREYAETRLKALE